MKRLAWLLAFLPAAAHADYRYYFLDQSDFGAKQGFYLDLEANGPSVGIDKANIFFGVADGKNWSFLPVQVGGLGEHKILATIGHGMATLQVDDKPEATSQITLFPKANQAASGMTVPGWADGPATFSVTMTSLVIRRPNLPLISYQNLTAPILADLNLFEPQGLNVPLPSNTEADLRIEVTFKVVASSASQLPDHPIIDLFGEPIAASWPDKAVSVEHMREMKAKEDAWLAGHPAPANEDKFGGQLGTWTAKATGFYRVDQRNGFWWMISPLGHPLFYTGLCTAPNQFGDSTPVDNRQSLFLDLPPSVQPGLTSEGIWGDKGTHYVCFHTWNLIRRDGPGWEQASTQRAVTRIKDWGFTGGGKWCGDLPGLPTAPVLYLAGVSPLKGHPDVYDPAVQAQIQKSLEAQIKPRLNDPLVVGWSITNEYDGIVTPDEVKQILALPASTPAKKAMITGLLQATYAGSVADLAKAWGISGTSPDDVLASTTLSPTAADVETMRVAYETAYHKFLYQTVKSIDPNHMYLGFWIVPGWWVNDHDWDAVAPYCDAIGYDRYANNFADADFTKLLEKYKKPVLLGEWSFPPFYGGKRGYGKYMVNSDDDASAGADYAKMIEAAAQNPYCVGAFWFEYHDEPFTGRGPGKEAQVVQGEHYAFGFVDEADAPRYPLIEAARAANTSAAKLRQSKTGS